ncbi:MAG: hypothetical protein Harvfovirus13_15 [Harvfovirus sp.]|uniref:Uncharacterized protein n=1 Tax=Harvfovirus sp. TaxID=2487768 RepID=A0A3G5A6A1_9VIRU|nr:MAG: hypothetical protein Harvfovirus13_15 [Harvfovirus sp.]
MRHVVRRIATWNFRRSFSTSTSPAVNVQLIDTNKVFPELNKKLLIPGRGFVEYIFTKPDWQVKLKSPLAIFGSYATSHQNPYGHGLIRYGNDTLDTVMNISGKGDKLVNFFDPETYFFVPPKDKYCGNPQGGIFKRSFVTLRIDNLSPEIIQNLHEYFLNLQIRNERNQAGFTLIAHIFTNMFRKLFKSAGIAEKGNCAYWTSKGLVRAGIIKHNSNWPLLIFFRLLARKLVDNDTEHVNIISYRSLNFKTELKGALVYPFHWLWNAYQNIWNLENFATVVVKPEMEKPGVYRFNIMRNKRGKDFWFKVQGDLLKIKRIGKKI